MKHVRIHLFALGVVLSASGCVAGDAEAIQTQDSEELVAASEDSRDAPDIAELEGTAMPASAQPEFTWDYVIYTTRGAGAAYWEDYGEHAYVCDHSKDGYRVVLFYYTSDDGTLREAHNASGVDTCGDLNLSISESGYVVMNVCLQNGASGSPFGCSGWYDFDA